MASAGARAYNRGLSVRRYDRCKPLRHTEVSVQLPTPADDVTLLACAARAPVVLQSIAISSPPGTQQQTRRIGVQRPYGRTDRRPAGRKTVS